jgi:carbon monoxide dehydrogenase subunit G
VKLQGQHTYSAPRAVVWRALLDPAILARTLPGCDGLRGDGPTRFLGTLDVRVGPIQGAFAGTVELSDLVPEERFRIAVRGTGAPGFVDGAGEVRLASADGATVVHYDLDVKVGGRVASVGQRLLDSTARAIARQALEGLGRQLEALAASPAAPAGGEPPAAPTPVRFAGGVARDVAADLVGPRTPWLVALALAALAVIVSLILWGVAR